MKKLQFITVMLVLGFSIACKKEMKDKKESRMDLITSGTWKAIRVTAEPGYDYDIDGDIDTELFPLYDECDKDMGYTFKSNGVLEVKGGHSKCDTLGFQDYSLHWGFRNDEKNLLIERDDYLILELTTTRLKLQTDWNMQKMTVTYSK